MQFAEVTLKQRIYALFGRRKMPNMRSSRRAGNKVPIVMPRRAAQLWR
jgi:hypothetical protein